MNRISLWMFLSASLLSFVACDPIESGEIPTFNGTVSAKVLASDQVSLTWNPGSDDLVPTDELRYGIWFVKNDQTLNLDAVPNLTTQAGAISYNLTGLEAETTYQAIVRTRDTGDQYSDNTQTINFTTAAENAGTVRVPQTGSISFQASGMITGFVTNQALFDIGLIDGTRIRWYAAANSDFPATETSRTEVNANILEAYLIPTSSRFSYDLFVITTAGITYFNNNDGSFVSEWTLDTNYVENTLEFYLQGDTLTAFSFIESGTTGRIYSNDAAAQNSSDTFFDRGTVGLPTGASEFFMERIDGDNFVDMISFGTEGFQIAIGTDEDYNFADATVIDDSFAKDSTKHTFLKADGDGDNDSDLYVYERDAAASTSQLHIWESNGDGTFQAQSTTNYNGAIYTNPTFTDSNRAGGLDLMFLHAPGNNVGVFEGGAANFNLASDYFGTDATPLAAIWGPFDEDDGNDLALVTRDNLIVLRRVPQASF